MKRLLRTLGRFLFFSQDPAAWTDDDDFEYEWACWKADGFRGADGDSA